MTKIMDEEYSPYDFGCLWEEVYGRHENRYSGLNSIPSLRDEIESLRMEINKLKAKYEQT